MKNRILGVCLIMFLSNILSGCMFLNSVAEKNAQKASKKYLKDKYGYTQATLIETNSVMDKKMGHTTSVTCTYEVEGEIIDVRVVGKSITDNLEGDKFKEDLFKKSIEPYIFTDEFHVKEYFFYEKDVYQKNGFSNIRYSGDVNETLKEMDINLTLVIILKGNKLDVDSYRDKLIEFEENIRKNVMDKDSNIQLDLSVEVVKEEVYDYYELNNESKYYLGNPYYSYSYYKVNDQIEIKDLYSYNYENIYDELSIYTDKNNKIKSFNKIHKDNYNNLVGADEYELVSDVYKITYNSKEYGETNGCFTYNGDFKDIEIVEISNDNIYKSIDEILEIKDGVIIFSVPIDCEFAIARKK